VHHPSGKEKGFDPVSVKKGVMIKKYCISTMKIHNFTHFFFAWNMVYWLLYVEILNLPITEIFFMVRICALLNQTSNS
jgi:hypothetical protein